MLTALVLSTSSYECVVLLETAFIVYCVCLYMCIQVIISEFSVLVPQISVFHCVFVMYNKHLDFKTYINGGLILIAAEGELVY